MENFVDDAVYASNDEVIDIYDAGEKNKQLEIAKNLLTNNVSIDIIVNSTGLTKEEIENL